MSPPWMPLYIADYLSATEHLGAAESGAYLHLIMHYWQKGKLPTEDRFLARIARMTDREWAKSKPVLADFFGENWSHSRIDDELEKAAVKSEARAEAGARGGRAKALKTIGSTVANGKKLPDEVLPSLPQQTPSNTNGFALASSSDSTSQNKAEEKEAFGLEKEASPNGSAKKSSKSENGQGHRLPSDWKASEELIQYALDRGISRQQVIRVEEDFVGYWAARAGKDARRTDWKLTWERWIRTESDKIKARQPPAQAGPVPIRRLL